MKKFTLIAAAAILAASAAQAAPVRRLVNDKPFAAIKQETPARKTAVKKNVKRHTPAANMPGPSDDLQIVYTAPEGKSGYYSKEGMAYGSLYGMWAYSTSEEGYVAEIVLTEDKMYMAPCFSTDATHKKSYLVADIKDGVATFTFPQMAFTDLYYDANDDIIEWPDYAMMMEYTEDEEGYFNLVPCEKQTISFNINEDGTITPVEELEDTYIAAAYWYDDEETPEKSGWFWDLMGDNYTKFTPITATPTTLPEGITTETWNVINGKDGYTAQVAIEGTDIYVVGLFQNMPEGVIAGKLENGKATFPSVNYLGIYTAGEMASAYVMSVEPATYEDPDYGVIDGYLPDGKDIVFAYDETANTLTTEGVIGLSMVENGYLAMDFPLVDAIIAKPSGKEITEVPAPTIIEYYTYDDEYGAGAIGFSMTRLTNGTDLIPADKLYFTIYMDDEPYVFEPDEIYTCISEPTSLIPYGIIDETQSFDYDDYSNEEFVYLFVEGFETIGVQAIYKDGDKEVKSEITTINGKEDYFAPEEPGDDDSIVNITDSNAPAAYFDLQGRKISAPAAGQIAIRKAGNKATVVKF